MKFLKVLLVAFSSVVIYCKPESDDDNYLPVTLIGQRAAQIIRNRLLRQGRARSREVCYDMVGCFPMPRAQVSPLKKPPQSPEEVDTKFMLLTQKNPHSPLLISYGNPQSLRDAEFNFSLPTKIIVHGFKGSGRDKGALEIVSAFLQLENTNVILVDWQKGAAGPSYVAAASNTQLVGRQLALLVSDIVSLRSNQSSIHIIGFSLGAHVAGYAGRSLKEKGIQVGRITGLDPASVLFRELFATSLSPLSKNDAEYVDVIHTDGTRFLTEGLGIFRPIGHTDYFPNGGLNQPGCNHIRGAVIVSHLGGSLNNVSLVCNHIRAWQLFHESLMSRTTGCEFTSFPCSGGWTSFQRGNCFPSKCEGNFCGRMGYASDQNKILGPLYLVTRDSSPFCGYQLKASVHLSKLVSRIRGYMQLTLSILSDQVHFQLFSELRDEVQGGLSFNGLAAAKHGTVSPDLTPVLTVYVSCNRLTVKHEPKDSIVPSIEIDEVSLQDIHGNQWKFSGESVALQNINGTMVDVVKLLLKLQN